MLGYKLSPELTFAPVFANSAIFPVNKTAKIVICDKSLKPSFLVVTSGANSQSEEVSNQ
jgi:hypothetical protein